MSLEPDEETPMYINFISYINCDVTIWNNCIYLSIYYANYTND